MENTSFLDAPAVRVIWLGIGATVFMDLWAWLSTQLFATASLDYALVGRWLGHMRVGTFVHSSIAAGRGEALSKLGNSNGDKGVAP